MDVLLLAALVSTSVSAGIVWFLQLNHYPLYREVPKSALPDYIAKHNRRLLLPVVMPMLVAIATSAWLAISRPRGLPPAVVVVLAIDIFAIVVSTVALQGPAHVKLEREGHERLIEIIVRSNWIRTFGWTINVAMLATVAATIGKLP